MLEPKLKRQLFEELFNKPDYLGVYNDYDGILTFLNKIWPLKDLPSQDSRYKNAYEDARQHLVNNDDWTPEFTYTERFNLLSGDEIFFIKFLEAIVSPDVRKGLEDIKSYVRLINDRLKDNPEQLVLVDYFEELPVFKYSLKEHTDDLPLEMQPNTIRFYKAMPSQRNYPFFLIRERNWNDFWIYTVMELSLHISPSIVQNIGTVKIMKVDAKRTFDEFPESFVSLDNEYCSLGIDEAYYNNLKEHLGNQYQSVLLALRDAAIFPRIAEEFENDETFKTALIRYNEQEQILRTVRFTLNGIDYSQAFKFNYKFRPLYAANQILLNFDFQYGSELDHRVYGLIGKNGTGKTQILSMLANDLSMSNPGNISPKKPLYGKIFTVSYSFFDRFDIPQANAEFNYVYCGLKKREGGWLTEQELKMRFLTSADKIIQKREVENWKSILENFIPPSIIAEIFHRDWEWNFVKANFNAVYSKVSSGQNILLFIITEILAQVRYNSLILYDEPETHLHPNAISSLMNTIYDLVRRFNSFCIIATHSPLVIQELQSRNIYVIEREEDFAKIRQLEKEAFGENLTVISEEIFGNKEIPKHHLQLFAQFVEEGKSMDEITQLFETENRPLSLNARLYIKSLITSRNEEPDTLF